MRLRLLELLDNLMSTIGGGRNAGGAGLGVSALHSFIIEVEFDDIACEKSLSVKTDSIAFCASSRFPIKR